MNIFFLMMGGSGTRFGADRPKQYIEIDGRPVFSYIIERCNFLDSIDQIVVISHHSWIEYVESWMADLSLNKPWRVVAGGNNRSESVKNGLLSISASASPADIILIHDATHPYLHKNDIDRLISAVQQHGAATLGQQQYDTVYQTNREGFLEKVIPRELVVSGASPEAFRYGMISEIYMNASHEELSQMTSAGAIALERKIPMKVLPLTGLNLKITYPQDMELFRQLIHTYFFREDTEDE